MEAKIKNLFLALGAVECGIAGIERFTDAPVDFHPRDIFPGCNSVIVFLVKLPFSLSGIDPGTVYTQANNMSLAELDRISFSGANLLDNMGYLSLPLPADGPYDYWDAQHLEGKGILSLRHAAQAAGLGSIGKNHLLLNKKYGSFVSIGAVLTSCSLISDQPSTEICLPDCRLCLDNCPTQALVGQSTDQARCRPHTYTKNARGFDLCVCNTCRTICPSLKVARKNAQKKSTP